MPDISNELTGGKRIVRHRWWDQTGAQTVSIRPPKSIAVNENNVALPGNALAALAAGASATLTMTAQRDCLIRELFIDAYDAAAAIGSAREGNISVTALTVAGENCFAGNGSAPARMFFPDTFGRPEFDLPVKGGTAVVVSVTNLSASVAGTDVMAGCKID